jgi:ribosomal protein L7/L12
LIPEDQRDTMKKISKTLGYAPIVKLIKATTNLGLKEAKLYYELYLK